MNSRGKKDTIDAFQFFYVPPILRQFVNYVDRVYTSAYTRVLRYLDSIWIYLDSRET